MKHILLRVVCMLCANIALAGPAFLEHTNTTKVQSQDKVPFRPILIDQQYISEQSIQFISKEISFVRVVEEASKFWQTDTERTKRWEPRVKKYFNHATYSKYELKNVNRKFNLVHSQSDINKLISIITSESIAEFSKEIAVMGCIWVIMGIIVLGTKGKFFVLDIILTTCICVWFGLKNQMIKDNLEDFIVLKNDRLSEMVSGRVPILNSNSKNEFKLSKELSGFIHFLE
ncbi:hypothetical protein [Formosa sp. 4Alg 33]|uniref:hypothetical protein n=1 Tax=Formosa sp. 4Alg 33 TaxID=3382189 RepID=UPI003D9BFF8D